MTKVEEIIQSFLHRVNGKEFSCLEFLNLFTDFGKKFNEGDFVHQIAENIKKDDLANKNLAAKSYSHENGFAKLVIWENENSMFRLRLHFWDGSNKINSNIHNHRFNFTSFILKGAIKNFTWILDDKGDNFSYYHYLPRLENGTYKMHKIGNAKLRISEETILTEGDVYYLSHETLHTSENWSENLVTLFIEDRSVLGKYAKVYTNRYTNDDDFIINSPPLEMQDYIKTLERISSCLQTNYTSKNNCSGT